MNYPELYENMKSSIIAKAQSKEAGNVHLRPSRRGYSSEQAWWQTNQDMHRTVLAHALTDNPTEQVNFLDALLLEADWGLGRNPLNMIQMTTATTELADKRSIMNCYTSGRNDGTPGLHPGHTPYLNVDGWGGNMVGSNPGKVLAKFYPDYNNWGHASKFINTRYIWAHSEFTPRQTMRGKALLYAYLYNLSKSGTSIIPEMLADAGPDVRLDDSDKDGIETVQFDDSRCYSLNSLINSYKWSIDDSVFATTKNANLDLEIGTYKVLLEIEDTSGNYASDSMNVTVVAQFSDEQADYDFETAPQADDWYVENWGDDGGIPIGNQSDEKARRGSFSYELEIDFVSGSEYAFRRDANLADDVGTIRYHVWVPQELVDSANAIFEADTAELGGIQNYFMHEEWQWVSEWYGFDGLKGNRWNQLDLVIPDDVIPSTIKSLGVSFKTNDVVIGENVVYVDDIFFLKEQVQDDTTDNDTIDDEDTTTTTTIVYHDNQMATREKGGILYTNTPNPFHQVTKIKYHVPSDTLVEMTVYDLAGRRVKTLVNERKAQGTYEVVFDGTGFDSGVYFYKLRVGKHNEMKKMILLK